MKNKRLMPPLWIAYPSISRGSIGWRMGSGEYYRYRFWDWFEKLSESDKQEYISLFPEPKTWEGIYNDDDTNEEQEDMFFYNDNLFIPYWQKNGKAILNVEHLKQKKNSGEKIDFLFFWGHRPSDNGDITKSCLSQWWKCSFSEDIYEYCCMEQYMMFNKAQLFGDDEIGKKIMDCTDPNTIKKLGRKVKNFNPDVWDKVKYSIILNGNYLKFIQNPKLRNFLLSTGNKILVEASPYDNIWGIQMSANDIRATNPNEWCGNNLLGFALTEVREEIKRIYKNEHLLDYTFIEN